MSTQDSIDSDVRDRQSRSAQHYLVSGQSTARLRGTIALAARTLDFPVATVNIVDAKSSYVISQVGLGSNLTTARPESFCEVVVAGTGPVVVPATALDSRFAHYPSVRQGLVGSYIGVPLVGREAVPIGTMCVFDHRSRQIDAEWVERMIEFASIVEDQLDLMRRLNERNSEGEIATAELAAAIAGDEIAAWYQPIIDLGTHRPVGFEALARWEQPSGNVADPVEFVPLAEDSDLVIDLDLSVMRSALADLRRWQRRDPGMRMGVNLSTRHVALPGSFDAICAVVEGAGVSPTSIDLELTETSRLVNSAPAQAFVRRLRDAGFGVLLDDFGTGWSSLEYLLQLPVSGLKIDRVVTLALGTAVGDAVTRSVANLARDLGLNTTIEGISTTEQAERARELGCERAQGFLWSQAAPAAAIDYRRAG